MAKNISLKLLNNVYKSLPETSGCMEQIAKGKDGCGAWCCQVNSPSVFHVEFLNTWNYIINNWNIDSIIDIVEDAINTYLSTSIVKGCIFWDKETKLCRQHETRPYACYVYGITPKEDFDPRYEKIKELYKKHNRESELRYQCNLIKTVDGSSLSKEKIDSDYEVLKSIEVRNGTPKQDVHDAEGGSYRHYYEHILLQIFPDDILEKLSLIRENGTELDKKVLASRMVEAFRLKAKSIK